MRCILTVAFLFACRGPAPAGAASPGDDLGGMGWLPSDVYDTNEGLPDPTVNAIAALPDGQVWLGETELGEEDEAAWAYVVVRPSHQTPDGVTAYLVAVPSCSDASSDDLTRYGLERDGSYGCTVSDIGAFADYLRARHGDDFADPDWWDQN